MSKSVRNNRKPLRRRPQLEEIEPRILYSADFAPGVVPDSGLAPQTEQRTLDPSLEFVQAGGQQSQTRRHEIVFVDSRTPEYQKLVDDIRAQDGERDIEVVMLDARQDGVKQITDTLAGREDISAIHIVSHGAEGSVQLGKSSLNFDSLLENASKIKGWANALTDDADILIYGCDVAASAQGKSLVDALARLTGADVAASEDRTGAAALGGNWDLEFHVGVVENSIVFSQSAVLDWNAILATYTVTNTNNAGAGSLRTAINNANANAGADTIAFNIAGAGVHTIDVTSALPGITDTVVIDGTTQPGFAGTPLIEIDGQTQSYEGLYLDAGSDGSTIKGLAVNNFMRGIYIFASSNNVVVGNFLGTDATGTVAKPNWAGLATRTSNNTIGGTSAADRNIISGNSVDGIQITGASGGSGNVVMGNYIGLDVTGTADLGNANQGIALYNGAKDNIVGGTTAGAGNVISGNNGEGVRIVTAGTTGNVVVGNLIGTNAAGTAGIANNRGVWIDDTAADNTVGGTAAGSGNIIAYNTLDAVTLTSTAGQGNSVLRNAIYSNGGSGIDLRDDGVSANDGATTAGQPNLLMDFPLIQAATLGGTTLTVSGYIGTAPNDTDFANARVEFFKSPNAAGVNGQGQVYLGFLTADASGNFAGALSVSGLVVGDRITATATDPSGNTSEFAVNVTVASNTAPVLANTVVTLNAVNEDAGAPVGAVGTLISALVGGVSDADGGAVNGIAITAADASNGTWFYSTNSGGTWNALGVPSAASSRLLAADANTRVYFQPNPNYHGTLATAITFRAWDQTSGTNGGTADTSSSGGITAFSSATDTAALTVNAVNDAPVASGSAALPSVLAGALNPPGTTVSSLFAANYSDATDAGAATALSGVAIIGNAATGAQGAWQYSSDGVNWNNVATAGLGDASALVLPSAYYLRFLPAAGYSGTPGALTVRLSDTSAGAVAFSASSNISAVVGGTGNWSAVSVATSISVNAGSFTAYEDFDYTAGGAGLNGSGGSGWSSAWNNAGAQTLITNGGLTSPGGLLATNANGVQFNIGSAFGSTTASRDLASSLGTTSGTVWISFLLTPDRTTAFDYAGLTVGQAGQELFMGYTGTNFKMNDAGGGGTNINVPGVVSGQTAFLVLRLDLSASGNDTATLYLNPTTGLSAPDVAGSAAKSDLNVGTFNALSVTGGRGGSANASIIDEIRIGDSYASVAPQNQAPATSDVSASGAEDAASVAVTLSATDPDGTIASFRLSSLPANGTLYLDAGLTTAAATGTDYAATSDQRTLYFVPAANWNGATTFQYVASDDDGRLDASVNTASITVNPMADTPPVTNATTSEDVQSAAGLVISRNAADGAEVTHFKITGITGGTLYLNNGTTVVNNGDFVTFAQGNAGLKFTPSLNSTASGSFDVQASTAGNNGGLGGGIATATIAVTPVNDEPGFTLSGNQTVNEDAGAQTVNGFASAAPGGGADEAGQTFTYTVSNNNNALFVLQPTIDASGNLSYTSAANAFGSATVTVFVTDSGGTTNGGDNTSPSQTFTITVNPVADGPTVVLPGAGLSYVEDQAGLVIDAGATVSDPEGNWNGGTLTVQITANAQAADRLTILNAGAVSVAVNGTDVLVGATIIGTTAADTATGGSALTITFNAAASGADVQAVARAVGYYSSSQDPSTAVRTVTFTATDSGALSGSATQTVTVARVNDAPSLTATASNPSYAAGAAAPVTLFSAASASTIEAGQTFSQLTLSVSNLADGAAERLRIDGTFVGLTNGNSATTAGNGYGVNVSVAGSTATVTITLSGASAAQLQSLVDGLAYEDTAGTPAGGPRTVTLTGLQDSGGTAGGGVDTSILAIASTATVTTSGAIPVAANDAYSLTEEGSLTASGVSGWWNTSWQYRRQIAIDNVGHGQLTDFPILIALNSSNIDYAQTQNQGQDLRFVDGNGALLAHEIESWNESGTSYVWVKVPVVDANSSGDSITMYYGNAAAADAQNADAVWNSSYVGVWHLNQAGSGAAGEFRDSSGTGNHGRGGAGVAAETPAQTTGRIGAGQNFDGANDFIEVQSTASLQLTTTLTLEGWVRMDSFGSADVVNALLRKGEGNPNNYQLSIGDQTPFFTLDDGENTGAVAPSTVSAGQWYHLSATFDGATQRLYINGIQVDANAQSGPIGTDLRDLYIGGRPGTDLSDGVIDEARISNTARSADWIAAQYANVTSAGYLTFGAQQSATGGGVLFNDSDADGQAVTAVLVTGPASAAAFTLNADGSFTYTPNANFAGTDTFTYRANDGSNNSNVATVTITVNPINDEPSFTVAGNQTVNEDAGPQTVAGFAVASAGGGADESSQTFTYTVSNSNNALFSGQPTIDASGNLTYTSAANAFGSATVTVFVTDSGGTAGGGDNTSPSQTFTITVNPVADTPSVTNATTAEDTQTTSGLVISRSAADGAEVTHFKITGIASGTLYLNNGTTVVNDGDFLTFAQANAGLKFTPAPNSTANGSFQVQASLSNNDAGLGGAVITATITVNAVNDAPVVTAGATAGYSENGVAIVIDNTVTVSDADDTQMVGATVTISAGLTAGDVMGFVDTATITGSYNAGTGVLTLSGTDTLAAYQAALRSVTYSSTSDDPTALSASRTIAWQVTDANADGSGAQASAVVTSSVNLSALADAPVVTAGAVTAYTENAVAVAIDNTITVNDADDTQISGATVTITAGLSVGDVLGFANTASITGVYNAGTGVLTLTGTDTLAAYQAALRSVTYSSTSEDPTASSASRTIAWQITDANSDGTGAQASAVVTSTVNLTAAPDAPVITAGAVTAYSENTPAVVIDGTLGVSDADDTQIAGATVTIAAGLTAGDVLAFVDTATITGSYNAGTGVLTLTGTDTLAAYQAALRSVTYSSTSEDPTALSASRSIVWQVTDADSDGLGAQASVAVASTVNIAAVNDAPVTVDDAGATDEDSVLNVAGPGVLANDSDVDGGPLTVSAVDGNAAAVGNPTALASGALLTLNADGSFSYDPNGAFEYLGAGESDTDTFTYEVADGNGGFATATVTVTVNGVNDAPTGTDAVVTVDEDSSYIFVPADFGFADADANDSLQAVRIVSLPLQGTLTLGGLAVSAGQLIAEVDIANGDLVFTPAADANGAAYASFTFRVNDGTVDAVAASTVTVDVTAVNDAPGFTQAGDQSVNEDAGAQTVIAFAAASAGGGADEAGQVLTYNVSNDNNALFAVQPTIDAAGTLTYTLAADANGVANVTVFVTDNGGTANGGADSSAAQVFTITVNAVNDAPTLAIGLGQAVAEDAGMQSVAGFASAAPGGGPDEAGQTLTYVVSNDNNALFVVQPTLDAAGNLTYASAADAFGTATVTVFVTDNGGTASGGVDASGAQTFTITVAAVNDAPVLGANRLTLMQGDSVILGAAELSAADVDDPAGSLTYTITNLSNGRFELISAPGVAITGFTATELGGGQVRFVHDGSALAPGYSISVSDGLLSEGPLAAAILFNPLPPVTVAPPPLPPVTINPPPDEEPPATEPEPKVAEPQPAGTVQAVFSPGRIENDAPDAQINVFEGGRGAPARLFQPVATLNHFTPGPYIDPSLELLAAAPANLQYLPTVPVDWGVRSAFPDAEETERDRIDVLLEQVQMGGMALSVGVVWWASRISGLLGSLLASAPAWRHIDPLPVVGRDEDEDKRWYDPNDRDADANELAIDSVLEGAQPAARQPQQRQQAQPEPQQDTSLGHTPPGGLPPQAKSLHSRHL